MSPRGLSIFTCPFSLIPRSLSRNFRMRSPSARHCERERFISEMATSFPAEGNSHCYLLHCSREFAKQADEDQQISVLRPMGDRESAFLESRGG